MKRRPEWSPVKKSDKTIIHGVGGLEVSVNKYECK